MIDKTQRQTFVLQQEYNSIMSSQNKMVAEHEKTIDGLRKGYKQRQLIVAKITDSNMNYFLPFLKLTAQMKLQTREFETTEGSSTEEDNDRRSALSTERRRERELFDLEHLEIMKERIEIIRETIGLDFEAPKFKDFIHNLDKMRDYEKAILEHENDIEKLQEELTAQTKVLEVNYILLIQK